MAKDLPSQSYGIANARFWRNVAVIVLAHVALITGLIRWSLAARASSPESIVWLGSGENSATGGWESEASPPPKHATLQVEPGPSQDGEAEKEKPVATTAKSEIELPSPTPNPTPTSTPTPKSTATHTPKPKPTPKPIPKPAPKKVLVAKASPKPSAKDRASPAKSNEKSEKKEKKNALAKTGSAPASGTKEKSSAGKAGAAGGGSSPAAAGEFGWYGNMLHDRFYSAWIQPTTNVASGTKISTLVKVRIEKDGHVSKFEIIEPSENIVVNESVAAVAKQVSEVDPPPAALIKGDHYDVKINFELNTEQGPGDR
jgi:outer membrane biosynthesis protein TonB